MDGGQGPVIYLMLLARPEYWELVNFGNFLGTALLYEGMG